MIVPATPVAAYDDSTQDTSNTNIPLLNKNGKFDGRLQPSPTPSVDDHYDPFVIDIAGGTHDSSGSLTSSDTLTITYQLDGPGSVYLREGVQDYSNLDAGFGFTTSGSTDHLISGSGTLTIPASHWTGYLGDNGFGIEIITDVSSAHFSGTYHLTFSISGSTPQPTSGDDHLIFGAGNDLVSGLNGNDFIDGGNGDDSINGNQGDDSEHGGDGNDQVFGGQGNDRLYGDNGDDRLVGDVANDTGFGGNGNDILEGLNGNDHLYGEAGNDIVFSNQGNDTLDGGDGDDLMRGGQGNDIIFAGNGNDMIFGDLGFDAMAGGNGNDTFVFDAALAGAATNPSDVSNPDVITDFDLAGDDVLLLGAPGNATNFLNTGQTGANLADATNIAASHMNGTVIYVTVNVDFLGNSDTIVFWDTDGDGHPDEAISLVNTPQALVQADDII